MIVANMQEKDEHLELTRSDLRPMKRIQSVCGVKMISCLVFFLTLVFTACAVPCSAETVPTREDEVAVVLWSAPGLGPEHADTQVPQLAAASTSEPPAEALDPTDFSDEESSESGDVEAGAKESIADPIEPVNRAFFHFNDKLYFWVLKPVATAYKAVLSEELRVCFRNFFSNLTTPVRVGNCLLQGEFKGAGNEAARFGINTTLGFFGFFDQGKDHFDIVKQDRDFGQTLGKWGLGPAFYINWPILGPSSLRDTAGFAGDTLMDPQTYLLTWPVSTGVKSFKMVNETSLAIGDYEAVKKAALDPYIALRDGYYQYRENKIKKK
jgi:phospholipid-binding lipoprotein MlaA